MYNSYIGGAGPYRGSWNSQLLLLEYLLQDCFQLANYDWFIVYRRGVQQYWGYYCNIYLYCIDDSSKEGHYCLLIAWQYIGQQLSFQGFYSFIGISLLGSSCLTTSLRQFEVVLATSSLRVVHTLFESCNIPILYYRFAHGMPLGSRLYSGLRIIFQVFLECFKACFPSRGLNCQSI